jgi:hypothetical protein
MIQGRPQPGIRPKKEFEKSFWPLSNPGTANRLLNVNEPNKTNAPVCRPRKMGSAAMRFMVMVKATKDSEAGVMPKQELLAAMGKFNEELAKAGVMEAGEGLHPSSKGVRVRFDGDKRTVIDGPFAETKELIAGYWVWKCKSREEAIAWLKKCPHPHPGAVAEVEIRPIFSPEDFGAELTPELREQEDRIRAQVEKKK